MGARLSRLGRQAPRRATENAAAATVQPGVSREELAREARLAAAAPQAEQVDETKKVGAQALQLGRMIQQRSTSISKLPEGGVLASVARPRLNPEEREQLNRGRLASRSLAVLMDACRGKSPAQVEALAAEAGVDPELLRRVLSFHSLPLGVGATTTGQLF